MPQQQPQQQGLPVPPSFSTPTPVGGGLPTPTLTTQATQGGLPVPPSLLGGADEGAPEPTGAAFRFLEALRIPQSAVFSAVIAGGDPNRTFGQVFETRPSFRDVLNAGGVPEFEGRVVVEFLGDVIIDPLNLIPVGLARKGLTIAGRTGIRGIRALERIGLPGIETADRALTKAFRGALTEEGRVARQLAVQARREQRLAAGAITKQLRHRDQQITQFAREIGIGKTELDRAITSRVEARVGAYENLSVERTLLDELGAGSEPVFSLREVARAARESGPFNPQQFAPLSPQAESIVAPLIEELSEGSIRQLQLETAAGLPTKALDSQRLDYILHIIHPDARRAIMETVDPGGLRFGRSWNPQHASMLARELRDVSIAELNTLSMRGRLALTGFQRVPLFVDNPAALDALRAYRGARAISSAKLFDDVTEKFGVRIQRSNLTDAAAKFGLPETAGFDEVRAAAIRGGFRAAKAKGMENVWLPAEVADVVDNYFQIAGSPTLAQKFGRYYSSVQNSWKAWTLAVFPEYHTRNIVGNVWNNWLAGLSNPVWYGKAAQLQSLVRNKNLTPSVVRRLTNAAGDAVRSADDFVRVGSRQIRAQDLLDEMAEHGVLRGGIFGAELDQASRQIMGPTERGVAAGVSRFAAGRGALAAGRRGVVQRGFDAGQMFEDNARIAHYLWRRSKGDSVEKAADSVRKFLFNYDELDPFTEAVRNVIPFLTWTRFNVPLQLEHLIVSPQKASAINKLRIAIENMEPVSFGAAGEAVGIPGLGGAREGPDERYLADYARENMAIRVRRTGKNDYDLFLLENWLPLADLSEVGLPQLEEGVEQFAREAGDFVIDMLSPLITLPVETATQRSLFFDREFLPERREFLGVDMPEWASNILRSARVLSVVDRFIVAPKDTTLGQQLVRTLTGIKVTPQDVSRGQKLFYGRLGARERDLLSAYRRSLENGRVKEADRLLEELFKLRRTQRIR